MIIDHSRIRTASGDKRRKLKYNHVLFALHPSDRMGAYRRRIPGYKYNHQLSDFIYILWAETQKGHKGKKIEVGE